MSDDLTWLPAVQLAALVRRREVSPVELATATLGRIERLDRRLNSVVTVDADRALAGARQAERRALREDPPPLLGVPLLVKDLALTAGLRTTMGTRSLADWVPDVDDEHVARLRRAGMVVVGKTNVPELGTLPYTESVLHGPCRNPWQPDHTPGGSSGGAGAALAAGLAPAVTASDGAGSVRIPASNCGLFGLKPARGRISNGPLFGDTLAGLSTPGTLTRHVADAAALLDAMRGYALGDPHWAPGPARPYVEEVVHDPPPLRLALVVDSPYGPCAAEAREAVLSAGRLLEELGHRVEPFGAPLGAGLKDDFEVVWVAGLAALPVGRERLEPFNRGLADAGDRLSAARLLQAVTGLQFHARGVVAATAAFDGVLSPTLLRPPLRVGELRCDAPEQWQALLDTLATYVGLAPLANVTGQPSMSLPLGWSSDGLPLGVMVTGRPADEATLLRLAAQVQRACDWTLRRPPLRPGFVNLGRRSDGPD